MVVKTKRAATPTRSPTKRRGAAACVGGVRGSAAVAAEAVRGRTRRGEAKVVSYGKESGRREKRGEW